MTTASILFARIRKAYNNQSDEVFMATMSTLLKEFNNMNIAHKIQENRKCCPLSSRKIEAELTNNSSSKLTLNPVTGRISLKISNKASLNVAFHQVMLAQKLKDLDGLPPVTFRGKISYYEGRYWCFLQNESKLFNKRIEVIDGEFDE